MTDFDDCACVCVVIQRFQGGEHCPVTAEVAGSSPVRPAKNTPLILAEYFYIRME